jgi:hypothetical protein
LKIGGVLKIIGQNMLVYLSKFRCFSFVYKKMKRKRIDFEYTLVDEYLNQREKETLKALDALTKMKEPAAYGQSPRVGPAPKKPLLAKVNVTKSNRKPHP